MSTAGARWGGRMDASSAMARHWCRSSAARSVRAVGWFVQSLTLSDQDFLGRPLDRLPSTVPWKMVLDKVSWREMWPYQASFRRLTVARSGSCLPANMVTSCLTNSFVLCSVYEMCSSFLRHLCSKACMRLSRSAVSVQLSHP